MAKPFPAINHFDPPNCEEFWCSECDNNIIKSDDSATGKFFSVRGHVFDFKKLKVTGEWPTVVFAICSSCLKEKKNENLQSTDHNSLE
jgi:hypothetical protein